MSTGFSSPLYVKAARAEDRPVLVVGVEHVRLDRPDDQLQLRDDVSAVGSVLLADKPRDDLPALLEPRDDERVLLAV